MIILDNGHGVDTYGKASPLWEDGTQLFEWEFTRDVVKRIRVGLEKEGIKSYILVPEAVNISLSVRVNRANAHSKLFPGSFLISVHGNKGMKSNQGTGWEVWTSPGQTKSDEIATQLYHSAKKYLPEYRMRSDYSDADPDKESKFTILIKTVCPAVLTENLFYDNEKDCKFMLSDEGRDIIAKLHIEGIVNYLK